ncbi:DUF5946 family protein [Amycolatopsis sp. H20-H5]|uniref:DUF5946 family protein n=1 Tax=Amycolatopsis sp. H20-H5 TaxID=3046309 RepID=UPI002DB55CC8|nr:DUF5946 family protein [Amycolatopsis sp. H20-H5]MEC3978788.1 DUF5946 family protein [Amycolatopsis sp. H20-H5]
MASSSSERVSAPSRRRASTAARSLISRSIRGLPARTYPHSDLIRILYRRFPATVVSAATAVNAAGKQPGNASPHDKIERFTGDTTCETVFHQLLALDHSRQEPWGPLHGVAVGTYFLQHPSGQKPAALRPQWSLVQAYLGGGLLRIEAMNRRVRRLRRRPETDVLASSLVPRAA